MRPTQKGKCPLPLSDKPQTVASFESEGGHFLLGGHCGEDKGRASALSTTLKRQEGPLLLSPEAAFLFCMCPASFILIRQVPKPYL